MSQGSENFEGDKEYGFNTSRGDAAAQWGVSL